MIPTLAPVSSIGLLLSLLGLFFCATPRVIDWWDWGMKEDHLRTTVTLPCWINSAVVEPKDNERRPAIVVPASNIVEFTIA